MKDYLNYTGKVCVVTGAASGMGKAISDMLVELGADVYAMDWSDIQDKSRHYVHVDLSSKASIDEAFGKMPMKIDKYFGVAGLSGQQHNFEKTFTTNFISNKYIVEAYLEDRMAQGGALAFITSAAGLRFEKYKDEYLPIVTAQGWDQSVSALQKIIGSNDYPGPLAYGYSKRALNYFALSQMGTFAPKGVRVNVLMPGSTKSGMTDDFAKSVGGMENLINYTGLAGRLAESAEMAAPMVFLNSDMASYINGNLIMGDYGLESMIKIGMVPDPFDTKTFE